ncbi:hypothetical protein ACTFIW_003116 [Dictyostelium discoideum]
MIRVVTLMDRRGPTKIETTPALIRYEVKDILVDSSEIKYECDICNSELINEKKPEALQCKEGHFACKSCWEKCLVLRKECMICRTPIPSILMLSRSRYLENEYFNWLNSRLVVCPYSKLNTFRLNMGLPLINSVDTINTMVCNLGSMKFGELNSHLKSCESRIVQCKLCNARFVNKDSDKHQDECSKIYLQCGYCKNDILRSSLPNHKTNCTKYLIECNFCKKMVERASIQKHNNEDCQEYLVVCQFGNCGERLSRYKMSFHSLEHKYIDLLNEQNETIKEFNRKYSQLQFNYNQLKDETTNNNNNNNNGGVGGNNIKIYTNTWIINDYRSVANKVPHKMSIKSNIFTVGTHSFFLRLYPNGHPGRPGKFSIYLERVNDGDGALLHFLTSISIGNVFRSQEIDFERSNGPVFAFEPHLDSKIVFNRTPFGGGLEIEVTINILQEKILPLTKIIIE